MRITGGTLGGAILKVPKGLAVRPTPDKVRLAIFNSLGASIQNASVKAKKQVLSCKKEKIHCIYAA